MPTTNECILASQGETVSVNRALMNYFIANGGTGSTFQDLEYSFLVAQGMTPGTVNDMWIQLLESLGYTGTINGMKNRFWCEGGGELANVIITPQGVCHDPGDTLTAVISDNDGVPGAGITYQWLAAGAPIAGATSSTYLLTTDELGKAVTVNVQYTSVGGTPRNLTSAPTCAIGSTNPEVVSAAVDAAGTTLTITHSEIVSGNLGFSLLADGVIRAISNPVNAGVDITFTTQVFAGESLRLSYTPGDVIDQYANPLLPFQLRFVDNGSGAAEPPIFTGSIPDFNESVGLAITPYDASFNFRTGPAVDTYALVDAPPWMAIDNTGRITGTPTNDADYPAAKVSATNAGGTTPSDPFVVTVYPAVTFVAQPISQLVEKGSAVTLAVIADGVVTYQWYRNGAAISGATNAEYTFTPGNNTDAYFCRCVNANGDYWDSNMAYAYPVVRYSNQVLNPGNETLNLTQTQHTASVIGTGTLYVEGNTATIEAA